MARTKVTAPAKALHVALLDGFEVKSRDNGTVHQIKADGKTVAEVCVGARAVRLNLRSAPKPAPKNLALKQGSKTWLGGGVVVTPDNLAAARAVLAAVAKAA